MEVKTNGKGRFCGRFEHALDPKRRLTIPSCWREMMGDPKYVFVMPDPKEKCLNLITIEKMETLFAQPSGDDAFFDDELTQSMRVLAANSEQLQLDVQGRIRIGDRLQKFAGFSGKAVMVGTFDRIQIWAEERMEIEDEIDQDQLLRAIQTIRSRRKGE